MRPTQLLRVLSMVIGSLSLLLPGCVGIAEMIGAERDTLESTGRYQELEQHMETRLKGTSAAKTHDLLLLCSAYSKTKRYNKLFPCLDRLEQNIRRGDKAAIPGEGERLMTYAPDVSPVPHLLRAEAYMELQNYDQALKEAGKAYLVVPSVIGVDEYYGEGLRIQALTTLSLVHVFRGDRASAEKYRRLLEGLEIKSLGGLPREKERRLSLAKIYMSLGEFTAVLEKLKSDSLFHSFAQVVANVVILGASSHEKNLFAYTDLPNTFMHQKALLETGRVSEAKEGYDRLLAVPQTRENGEIYWLLLYDRGRIAEKENNRRQAIEFYRKAVEVIEAQRASISTEASKIGFVGDKQAVYQRLIATLFAEGQYAVAFEYIERAKARALVDMLASKQDFVVHTANIAEVRTLLARANTAEAEGRMQDASAETARQRSLAVQTRQQLHRQAPELSSLVSVTPVTVQEIQNRIPTDEVLVEYYAEGKDLYAFVLSKTGLQGIKLNGEGLTADIQQFRQVVQDSRSSHYRDFAGKLYNRLVRPLEGAMKQRNVLIVAHGPLHYLPFNALHDGNGYLIERYSVRLLPSASVLKYLKGVKPQTAGTLLAFGNPDLGDPRLDLKHAQTEALNVSKVLPNSRALVRREASESAFKRYGEGFKYLHIASHGTFNADSPLTSALLLAKDSTNDGTLTVGELYSMRLNADLVTLSACETGLGKIANGDDVVGLTRGFLYAGSRSIVASLWKVDDEATAYLMTRFYGALKGTSKREALRLAQLETRKKYPHPYYWAAFQLTGEAS